MTLRAGLALGLCLSLAPSGARACTALLIPRSPGKVFAKSYDWKHADGMLLVNKRGVAKTALLARPGGRPARWVSRFGSVTFNQHGRELPVGGINEAGLSVEALWLKETRYPADLDPRVNPLQWVQYQLDNSADVGEALSNAAGLGVEPAYAFVHYLACDRAGECAAVEFLEGRLVAHAGAEFPVPALANGPYGPYAERLAGHVGFGGSRPIPRGSVSPSRFARAAFLAKSYDPDKDGPAEEYAFAALERLRQTRGKSPSQWQVVYSLADRRLAFRLAAGGKVQRVELGALDFSCRTPVAALPLSPEPPGDVSGRFGEYDRAANRRLVELGLGRFMDRPPRSLVEAIAAYPDGTACLEGGVMASSPVPEPARLWSLPAFGLLERLTSNRAGGGSRTHKERSSTRF